MDHSARPPAELPRGALGAVAIGRNEGERLAACLASLASLTPRVVYVDSGSTDDSVALAKSLGVQVVELDMSQPFSAARARNAGSDHLLEAFPETRYVQFVDGDCEVVPGWLPAAHLYLEAHPDVAVVCGRRRERHPEASIYNEMCDIEWDTGVGEATYCGGDALMRAEAFRAVGGFRPDLVAGEEPELCLRLRARGLKVFRLDREMTLHDAAILEWSQWWRRMVRSGYAYAAGSALHGDGPESYFKREVRRIWLWGAVLPATIVAGFVPTLGMSSALSVGYLVSSYRCYKSTLERGRARKSAATYAALCTLGKFAEFQGVLRFQRERGEGRAPTLIEYK